MKKVLYIALASLILMTTMNSCEEWLDVNTSPDQPTSVTCDVDRMNKWQSIPTVK